MEAHFKNWKPVQLSATKHVTIGDIFGVLEDTSKQMNAGISFGGYSILKGRDIIILNAHIHDGKVDFGSRNYNRVLKNGAEIDQSMTRLEQIAETYGFRVLVQ